MKYIWKIHITQYHFQYLQLGISIFSIYIQHPVLSSGQYFYNFFGWFSLKKTLKKDENALLTQKGLKPIIQEIFYFSISFDNVGLTFIRET